MAEEERKRKEFLQRRDQAKNEIVLKALAEFSDLEALRREKRAILEEEQRLKALLALELANGRGKADRCVVNIDHCCRVTPHILTVV